MRLFKMVIGIAMAAGLAACGGGGDGAESTPPMETAQPPAVDPSESWAMKPMLGTWTGTMTQVFDPVSIPMPPAVEPVAQSLTISSEDGVNFTVAASPSFSQNGIEGTLVWTGEPAFTIRHYVTANSSVTWEFKVVGHGQAEVTRTIVKFGSGIPGAGQEAPWKGVLTRSE